MRFLLDENQSPRLADPLAAAGHDVVHVRYRGMRTDGPSVLLIRRQGQRRARQPAALILANLDEVAGDLDAGAVVVLDADRIRVRRLPIRPH